VEESDDDELEYVGETLGYDEDIIMEAVDSTSGKTGMGGTGDPIEFSDAEDEDEDEESEISKPGNVI
jgi:hypothetical protein